MNIAICDDQPIICDELEGYVESAFVSTPHEFSTMSFHSGDLLLEHLKDKPLHFQIYLLDIEMAGTNGLDTANEIREQDQEAVIVFVTSHSELMPQAFRVLAFDFLGKPLKEKVVVEVLQSAFHLLQTRKTLFFYSVKKKVYSISKGRIEYMESVGRKIAIHTTDGEIVEYYGPLKDAIYEVEGPLFAQAHKSFVVNLEQIASLDSWQITMCSGAVIDIGNRYHAPFHAAYRDFKIKHRRPRRPDL